MYLVCYVSLIQRTCRQEEMSAEEVREIGHSKFNQLLSIQEIKEEAK